MRKVRCYWLIPLEEGKISLRKNRNDDWFCFCLSGRYQSVETCAVWSFASVSLSVVDVTCFARSCDSQFYGNFLYTQVPSALRRLQRRAEHNGHRNVGGVPMSVRASAEGSASVIPSVGCARIGIHAHRHFSRFGIQKIYIMDLLRSCISWDLELFLSIPVSNHGTSRNEGLVAKCINGSFKL